MNKLNIIRKTKSLFLKWNLHKVVHPFSDALSNAINMGHLSKWRKEHPVKGYNDFYQRKWDYNRRYNLYEAMGQQENLFHQPIDYFEFGVAGGHSFRWWLKNNLHQQSRFFGFDTFEGLPEKWGSFEIGAMAVAMESLKIDDPRASFYKGLFQETLIPFLSQYDGRNKRLIHLDADLFSSTLFTLTQLYRCLKPGDILLFDEFAVPQHEFLAFKLFTESFYIDYEVIGAANNYLFVAIKLMSFTGIKNKELKNG
ncbi:MAG: TylF/MycF family methyltransferase [Bacteroidota bacterium]|nr:macrocin O-methyltransferase [Flavisolibacter sp.]MDQ3844755.1 TylF/MycF family methyltransferase [Bacteroidota bacterium]